MFCLQKLLKRALPALVIMLHMLYTARAQQYNFKNYSVESGLPYVQIFAMYQDAKGYLWSGGYGGLSKFDGKKFFNYSPKNGLANHSVNAIIQDTDRCIAVGTIEGLSVLKNRKILNFHTKDGLPSDNVTSFCIDNTGKLWIGTSKGLCYYNGKSIVPAAFAAGFNITCLYASTEGKVYIGTHRGLYYFDEKDLAGKSLATRLNNDFITCLSQCRVSRDIYIGTHNGLYQLAPATGGLKNFHVNNGLIDEDINAVLCQANGTVWIGSKSGLISFNGKEFSYYTIASDNNSNHVRSLLLDFEDNLWIGTHNGLYRYRGKGFTIYDRQDGLAGSFIYEIARDKDKNLWVSTDANGVFKYANGYFKNYSAKDGLLDNRVSAVLPMDDGSVWFGTGKGISTFNDGLFENIMNELPVTQRTSINCFYKDSKGQVWAGGKNAICSIKKTGGHYVSTSYSLPGADKDCDVWTILEDDDGGIWVGAYLSGLYKLVNGTFVQQNIVPLQKVESVLELDKDHNGNLYAATLNGVLAFNPKKHSYRMISEEDGLSSELVYALKLTRDKKYIWTGTNQGINRIDVNKLRDNTVDIVSYGKADGFKGVECNTHGIYEDTDSSIWFGTVNGLIKYAPKEFIENTSLSKTDISGIKLSFQDTNLANGAVLPFSLNNITFEFTGICLTNPDKVRYTFKLEGFDRKWSPYTNENFVRYSNLSEGRYVFKVKSCNNEGVWTPEPTTFSFTIKPPIYRTWWFILFGIVFVTGVITLIFRLRLRQLKRKQKMELEQQIEISKSELKALRAQMNPHFVFNSLNSIQHFILNSKEEEAVKYLGKFARLIRTILNNSEKPMVTINEDIDSIKLYLELEKMRFDNKFDYTISIDRTIDADYDEIPPMLMQPYLENAILHGINPKEGPGHISIEVESRSNYIKCTITDDGVGREKAREVESLKPYGKHRSLGMKITKDRVRILNNMHNSNLSVNIIDLYGPDGKAIGTKVEIFIPYLK